MTNEITYLVLDILEELPIGDFPTTVRLGSHTDPKLLRRVAEVLRYGGGALAVYNEDTVIEGMLRYGYPLDEARRFANDGCWEVQVPGKTFFCYIPVDALRVLQQDTLKGYGNDVSFATFEELYTTYKADLGRHVEKVFQKQCTLFKDDIPSHDWKERTPCTAVSLFEGGCIEKGLSYLEGGPVYNVCSPHLGGVPDAANSLYALKKIVYDEKKLSLEAFLQILQSNWEGAEALRQATLHGYAYFGNDNDEVDLLAARILQDFSKACLTLDGRCGYAFPAGVSTFGRQLEWAPKRLATPSGKPQGSVLAANLSPTPGSDTEGVTAIIRSYCKIDHTALPTGSALDVKLLPSAIAGERGINVLTSLLSTFVSLGGFFMQPDVVDAAVLRAAQQNPEEYATLSVRISGWNARFITLNQEWQNMVIAQCEHP